MSVANGSSINVAPLDKSNDIKSLIESNDVPPQCCSTRLNMAVLMFLGMSMVYALRVNLSVAMVAMVNTTDLQPSQNSSDTSTCPLPPGSKNGSDPFLQPEGIPQYPWDSETQGWLLSAFFFGYLFTQIPGGYLSGRYGGCIFLGLGVLVTAVLTMFTPLAARMGPSWLFALRVTEGLMEGVTFPAMMSIWARWAPPLERSRLMTLSGSGGNFGAFVSLPLAGYICQTIGWPSVFYLCGGAGGLWAIFWFVFASSDPLTHRRISTEERDYIIKAIGPQGTGHGWSVPVLPMLLSVPLWAIIIGQICSNWSYYTLLTSLPIYMNDIMHYDMKSNGFLSALPYLGAWLSAMVSGVVADNLIKRKVFSITVVRKLFALVGLLSGASFLTAVSFAGCNHVLAVTFLTLSTTIGGANSAAVYINQIDIAPRYAGFLLGITNTFGTIPGIVAPIATGYLTQDRTLAGWQQVFWLAAGINVTGALVFTVFGSGNIQPWAVGGEEEEADAEKDRSRSIST
ncbi:sialin-like [Clinocottus analis]|uniref:sialin-like n=1 Tax=Clinocottus analis TaxID=304258 RepID=UPI0035BF5EAA